MKLPRVRKIQESDVSIICERYLAGESGCTLAAAFKVSTTVIFKYLKRAGVKRRTSSESNFKLIDADVIARYKAGDKVKQIAKDYSVTPDAIYVCLRRNSVKAKPAHLAHRKHSLNDAVFEVITEESAYWTGFLMADGCVCDSEKKSSARIQLNLALCDKSHVESFRDFLGASHKILTRRGGVRSFPHSVGRYHSTEQASLAVRSNRLAEALAKYGVVPRKSKTARVIELENNVHFWRGVIDGDGSLIVTKRNKVLLSLCGSFNLMGQFAAFVRGIAPSCKATVNDRGEGLYEVRANCRHAIEVIKALYGNCSIALPRKLQKAGDIISRAR